MWKAKSGVVAKAKTNPIIGTIIKNVLIRPRTREITASFLFTFPSQPILTLDKFYVLRWSPNALVAFQRNPASQHSYFKNDHDKTQNSYRCKHKCHPGI